VSGLKGWSFRPDIEGLRAIAVIAVLLYHAGIPWTGGGYVGVDVFFVISGFLITGILIAEVEASGRVDFRRFYSRRARRLLPAAGLALTGTAVLSFFALPVNRWIDIAGDLIASALYFVNWRLAGRSVDYLASEEAASPVQHFWSLAVEEQYYLVWPLLVGLAGWAAVRAGVRLRWALGVGVSLVAIPSFLWSIIQTWASPGRAYFVTTTRMWELAIGAALAIAAPRLPHLGRRWGAAVALVGLSGIGWAVVAYSASTPFPGWTAAIPTVGTALVIAAGIIGPDQPVTRALGTKWAQWVGARSYSLYLWHWPLVVAGLALFEPFPPWAGLLIVSLSVLPASLSYRFVEDPIRRSRSLALPRRALAMGVVFTGAGVLAGATLLAVARTGETTPAGPSEFVIDAPLAIDQVPAAIPVDLRPSLVDAPDDNLLIFEGGCHVPHPETEAVSCEFGEAGGSTVVLIGDSHAAQWVPALIDIAESQDWHLVTMSKSACPFLEATYEDKINGGVYEECLIWNEDATDEIIEMEPDVVIITSSVTNFPLDEGEVVDIERGQDLIIEGLAQRLELLQAAGLTPVVIRDTPLPTENVPDCLGRRDDVLACSPPRSEMERADVQREAAEAVGAGYVDLTDFICTPEICPAVVGSTLVWRDNSHLTSFYARALIPQLLDHLESVTEDG
jgi:peptidoglycan/LPS O-acetylase OafA/YrhL